MHTYMYSYGTGSYLLQTQDRILYQSIHHTQGATERPLRLQRSAGRAPLPHGPDGAVRRHRARCRRPRRRGHGG